MKTNVLPSPVPPGTMAAVERERSMHPQRRTLLWINLLGGIAVLGSYAHGLATHPLTRGEVWGDVPLALRSVYTANMFLAAAGYLVFTGFVFFRLDPAADPATSRVPYRSWNLLYALVLVPSALWMPFTFAMLDSPSPALWVAIRAVLATVGLASLGIVAALFRVPADGSRRWRACAIAGAILFALQTALLDALVWCAYFPA